MPGQRFAVAEAWEISCTQHEVPAPLKSGLMILSLYGAPYLTVPLYPRPSLTVYDDRGHISTTITVFRICEILGLVVWCGDDQLVHGTFQRPTSEQQAPAAQFGLGRFKYIPKRSMRVRSKRGKNASAPLICASTCPYPIS
jgi:hypothetical protein